MDMKNKPYIVINDEEPSDEDLGLVPDEDLGLDFAVDMEYNTPYTTYGEDNFNVGEVFETGGIFDDR